MKSSCVFCHNNRFQKNFKNGFSLDESLIYEDDNIYITPDLSPLVSGHLLIISHIHFNSFANASKEVKNSLKKALYYLQSYREYKDLLWFEHGAVFPGNGGASVDHAHMHVLPCQIDLQSIIEADGIYSEVHPYSEVLFESLANKQPYLWVSDNRFNSKLYYVGNIPSQYLRKLTIEALHKNYDYNWKENYNNIDTINRYRESLNYIKNLRDAHG